MFRGDDESFDVRVYEVDGVTAVNLSGANLRFTAKQHVTDLDADAVVTLTTAAGTITITNAALGQARLDVPASQTNGLTRDSVLVWDLQVFDVSNKTRTIGSGLLVIRRDVSRTTP